MKTQDLGAPPSTAAALAPVHPFGCFQGSSAFGLRPPRPNAAAAAGPGVTAFQRGLRSGLALGIGHYPTSIVACAYLVCLGLPAAISGAAAHGAVENELFLVFLIAISAAPWDRRIGPLASFKAGIF